MEKNWFILLLFVLGVIAVIVMVIKKNRKDRKDLFKKLPEDYPGPENVKSEFDLEDKYNSEYEAKTFTY
jgi:FtsZ-interacting cell division protein ZipA